MGFDFHGIEKDNFLYLVFVRVGTFQIKGRPINQEKIMSRVKFSQIFPRH
jgi:hypothetical protein